MSSTIAVPLDHLNNSNYGPPNGQPLCPGCNGGRLHPYMIEMSLGPLGFRGVTGLTGWVAVCVGNKHERDAHRQELPDDECPPVSEPCGMTVQMTPRRTA